MRSDLLQLELNAWTTLDGGRQSWSCLVPDTDWTVMLTAEKNDSLATVLWEIAISRDIQTADHLMLDSWANRVANQLLSLSERLNVVEIDKTLRVALLRSNPAKKRGQFTSYFELYLEGIHRATLRRYAVELVRQPTRMQIPFTITHEAIAEALLEIVECCPAIPV